jgi:hypothetical protein
VTGRVIRRCRFTISSPFFAGAGEPGQRRIQQQNEFYLKYNVNQA